MNSMLKRKVIPLIVCAIFLFLGIFVMTGNKFETPSKKVNKLEGIVVSTDVDRVILMDKNDVLYTFFINFTGVNLGDNVIIEYTGLLDKNSDVQSVEVIDYSVSEEFNESVIDDNGIFSDYYKMASNKLKELSLDEKIGQLLLARYPEDSAVNDLKKYNLSGFVLYEKDFANKTKSEVKEMIKNLQNNAKIPLLIAVDEEGGKVVRVSSNPNLVAKRFESPRSLYTSSSMEGIKNDTINKSRVLNELGINLNLAPVVDVTTDSNAYMYDRTIGEDTEITSLYAKTVIDASKGLGVSYTLKHFPGYGNNLDTHVGGSVDSRSIESIMDNDIPPFVSGIEAGAEAILVSHNIVNAIDSDNSASMSPKVHNLLRNELGFTGIIITDDIEMGATSNIADAAVEAILAGNNLVITTDYAKSHSLIKEAVMDDVIGEEMINKLALRVLAWKYYKGLMLETK